MVSLPFTKLVDAVGDPLGRLAQLVCRPVSGVALRHVRRGQAWLTSPFVSERGGGSSSRSATVMKALHSP